MELHCIFSLTYSTESGGGAWVAETFDIKIMSFSGPYLLGETVVSTVLHLLKPTIIKSVVGAMPAELGAYVMGLDEDFVFSSRVEIEGTPLSTLQDGFSYGPLDWSSEKSMMFCDLQEEITSGTGGRRPLNSLDDVINYVKVMSRFPEIFQELRKQWCQAAALYIHKDKFEIGSMFDMAFELSKQPVSVDLVVNEMYGRFDITRGHELFWICINRHVARLLEKRRNELRKVGVSSMGRSRADPELEAGLVKNLQAQVDKLSRKDGDNLRAITRSLDTGTFALNLAVTGQSNISLTVSKVDALLKFGASLPAIQVQLGPYLRWPDVHVTIDQDVRDDGAIRGAVSYGASGEDHIMDLHCERVHIGLVESSNLSTHRDGGLGALPRPTRMNGLDDDPFKQERSGFISFTGFERFQASVQLAQFRVEGTTAAICSCIVDSLSDVQRIKSYVGDSVNGSEIELGFEVMSALHKYLQHERFHVEINLRTTLATSSEGHLTVEVGATDSEAGTDNRTLRRMESHAGETSGKIQSPILLSACVHLSELFLDVDTLMTSSLKAGQLTAELFHGFRPPASSSASG
mmetsp:Transcript_61407/g.168602  ORF Transcript_61407/g.168602 Transcript_61407/m.168602 type:complete len:576 (+) Transcript_61407:1840-3567(+)